MANIEDIKQLSATYCAHEGLKLSTVGTYAANDGKFFIRLEAGASCTLRTAASVVKWFDENWPEDLQWPAKISRPSKNKDAA
jgi:hypothetical protein